MKAPSGYLSLLDTEPVGEKMKVPRTDDYHNYDQAEAQMSSAENRFADQYKGVSASCAD